MKKLVAYTVFFFIGFFLTFTLTFPSYSVISHLLSGYRISFASIRGDFFLTEISNLHFRNYNIPHLTIKNNLITLELLLNRENYLILSFPNKKIKLVLENLKIEDFQKKTELKGILSTESEIDVKDKNLLISGNGEFFLKYIPILGNINLAVNFSMKPDGKATVMKANISGDKINGIFSGKIRIYIGEKPQVYLEGRFTGNMWGKTVNRKVKIDILKHL